MDTSNHKKTFNILLNEEISCEQKAYLDSNPQIHNIMSEFLSKVLINQPLDAHKFAQEYFLSTEKNKVNYKPLIISGPSGVGKGTLIKMLLQNYPDLFELSVSYTTRKPREGEINGVHYLFVTQEEFNAEVLKEAFIEFTEVHGNFYGTHRGYVQKVMEKKKICILEIDVIGAKKVSKSGQECCSVFIEPPSIDALRKRLVGRGTEKEEVIELRLKNALDELEKARSFGIYNNFIINNEIQEAYENLLEFIDRNYPGLNIWKLN